MNNSTLLYRQVNPNWKKNGRISKQVFQPMSRSGTRLSVYNGDLISAQESWLHFTKEVHCDSIGVLAVTVGECATQDLKAYPDTKDFLEHAVIDFRDLTWGQMERKAKKLYNYALRRGWCFRPDFG